MLKLIHNNIFNKSFACHLLALWQICTSPHATIAQNTIIDSLQQKQNTPSFNKLAFTGYTHLNLGKQQFWSIGAIFPNILQFNTVEGYVVSQNADFHKGISQNKQFFSVGGTVRYGFSSYNLYAKGYMALLINRIKDRYIKIEGGRYIAQFNSTSPISPLNNTITSLFWGENLMKIYEKKYLTTLFREELIKGITTSLQITYEQRSPLINTSDYSLKSSSNKHYTSNDPLSPLNTAPAFDTQNAYIIDLSTKIDISRLIQSENTFPLITLTYKQANQDVNFSKIDFKLQQDYQSIIGLSRWQISGSKFLQNTRVPFIDYNHFAGNQSAFSSNRLESFALLNYFDHSNQTYFIQSHIQQHWQGYWFKQIPFLKKLGWHEISGIRNLYTPEKGLYAEINIGIENILQVYRFDFILSHTNNQLNTTLRFGISL
jgi:Family of unknown function (DUF5686)